MVSLFPPEGTVLEDVVDHLFCFFAVAECRICDANLPQVHLHATEDVVDHLFCFFAIEECRICDANLPQVHLQATVACLQPEYIGLLKSSKMSDWVCRGAVVSSGSSPLGSLTVVGQSLGFLVSGFGQGLGLCSPRLGQAVCSYIAWTSTVGWDPL